MKRALVLGCGGVAGGAWSIATLGALERELGWDAREADILIGTSVGAVLAALLAGGVSVERLMACQRGDAEGCIWNHDQDSGGALPPIPAMRLPAASLILQGLRGKAGSLTAAVSLLPQGRGDFEPFVRLIDSVVPAGKWAPHPAAWMMAVDAASGERVAFGKEGAPLASLSQAVCASYGVPGWYPPTEIAGRRFIDGGVASPTSADFLIGSGVTEAIVLAPMASTEMDRPRSLLARAERRMRRYMTGIVDREVVQLREAGIRVIRLEPGPEDLEAIGFNMMDPKRRKHVFNTALSSAPGAVTRAVQSNCSG